MMMVVVRAELLLKNSRTLNKDSRPAESDVIFTRGLLSIRANPRRVGALVATIVDVSCIA